MIVDSHCHLDYPGLAEDEAGVIARARAAGVERMVHIAAKRGGWPIGTALAERRPEVFCAVGIHPHEAGREGLDEPGPLVEQAAHPKVVAIGESGLDYFYDASSRASAPTLEPHAPQVCRWSCTPATPTTTRWRCSRPRWPKARLPA
jgi:TatD DNase family protein